MKINCCPKGSGAVAGRSYPTLHLIREASIDRAVEAFPEAESIYEANIATMEKLGPEGWGALQRQIVEDGSH